MADALPNDGKLVGLDISEKFTNVGQPYWKQAGVDHKIDLRIGPAIEGLQKLLDEGEGGTFDFAFIDADKQNYCDYYELTFKLIRKNGIIAIDNVLWSGRVLDDSTEDKDTKALQEISKLVAKDERVEHVLLPFADGVTLIRKL